jgi:RNA polymerase sigma-70 factor (ECF subfamily)
MMNTHEVVTKCLQNNALAQKELYDAFAPVMMGVCYRYTKNTDEASDVLQEGFVRVFRNLHQWKGQGELGAWIRRIMVNTALNWIRDHRKIQWLPAEDIPEEHHTQQVPTPADSLQARQLADLIRQLPGGYQTVFNLHAVEGYTHVEIGQLLGINEGTSRSQYLRARRLIADKILALQHKNEKDYAGRK